jgi:hypothetical protein
MKPMTELTLHRPQDLSRKANLALTIAIILGVIEILRRTPPWLLVLVALLVSAIVSFVLAYAVWSGVALGVVVAWRLSRGFAQGWRESR